MKKSAVLLCLVMASSALAVVDPDADHVGIYFDETADTYCKNNPLMYQPNSAYLVLTHCSTEGTLGWELTIVFDAMGGYSSVIAATPRGAAVDVDPAPLGFAVGLATALPASDAIVLADMTYFYTGPCKFFLGLPAVQSIPGHMAFLNGADVGDILPMYPSSGDFALPVAQVGECVVLATGSSTWGGVRSMYR